MGEGRGVSRVGGWRDGGFSSASRIEVLSALVFYDSRAVHGGLTRPSDAQHFWPIPLAQTYSNVYLHKKLLKPY